MLRSFKVTGRCRDPGAHGLEAVRSSEADVLTTDAHFQVQDFRPQGIPIPDVVKMMDGNVCRAVLMGLSVTIAHDPLVDATFAPVYYTQTDGQALYYNAIQDVPRRTSSWRCRRRTGRASIPS